MDILIDNKNLETEYGVKVLDYKGVLSVAAERPDERTWHDKSGVEKLLTNLRYETNDFVLECIIKATNEVVAYNKALTLAEYLYSKGLVVLSLRDEDRSIRECFIVERSDAIVPDISVRFQNGLYYFSLGLRDVNPNAVKYKTEVIGNEASVSYTKGRNAIILWGDGSIGDVSNSGVYTKADYTQNGKVDIIIDVDKTDEDESILTAAFSADALSGIKDHDVQFTDASTGDVALWSWNFGDNTTSSEQNPTHTYTEAGVYTVKLQVFNTAQGSALETKTDYITVRDARVLINDDGNNALIDQTDGLALNN